MLLWVVNKQLRLISFLEGAWLLLTEPMSGSRDWSLTHRQVDKALNAKLVELADGNLESKSLGCGGICCNGRKLFSVQGGDCSKRSIFLFGRGGGSGGGGPRKARPPQLWEAGTRVINVPHSPRRDPDWVPPKIGKQSRVGLPTSENAEPGQVAGLPAHP